MARPPTAAQRRIIEAADPVTGRLRGSAAQLAALVRLKLAFRHPRPPHDHFLTPAGQRLRQEAAERTQAARHVAAEGDGSPKDARGGDGAPAVAGGDGPRSARPESAPAPGGGVFAARVGGEAGHPGPERGRQVRSAWQGLLELRHMTHPDGSTDRPGPWERAHLVQAAALALEAAGCAPATDTTDGYRVTATPQPEAVAVHAPAPGRLGACADALEAAGWQPSTHTEPRTGTRYLLASPRRK